MGKLIEYGDQAKTRAVTALDKIATIVGSTLGPSGSPVMLTKETSAKYHQVFHTKDGITVLRELEFSDPVEDAIHKLAIQASTDTVIQAGDGSTSILLMAAAFAKELRGAGQNNPQSAIRKFKKEIDTSIEFIKTESISGHEAELKVAMTSSNSDEELANTVIEALSQTSAYGTVVVEKNTLNKTRFTIDKAYGYQGGTGYAQHNDLGISISDNAVTNGEFMMSSVFTIPYNGQIIHFDQIIELIRKVSTWYGNNFKLLFVCYDYSDEIVYKLIQFNRQNPSKIFIIKTNATAEYNGAWQQLNDVAAFCGSTVLDAGTALDFCKEDLGAVKTVRVNPYKTFLLGMPTTNWVTKRAEQNQKSMDLAPTQLDKDIISSRNSSLTGGLVKIIVGGGIPSEIGETADRVDDAVRAVQACRRSGALPGAGLSYIRAANMTNASEPVRNALSVIHNTIMANYGEVPYSVIEKGAVVRISDNSIEHGDFLELGIADSFETVKSVILNGFALGSLVANLGGYAVKQNLEELRQQLQLKQIMES
jgi:chaperonin GroEL